MLTEHANQGDPIGIEISFTVSATGAPYDATPTFAAITPTGRKIAIPGEQVEHPSAGTYRAWYSSKLMPGLWRIEAYGAADSDPVGVQSWQVKPTKING